MPTLSGLMGVVETVDTTHYTCTVRTEHSLIYDVPLTPVFLSPNGQGMWFLPEPGTRVLVGTLGNGTRNEYTFMIGASFGIDQDPFAELEVAEGAEAEEEVIDVDFRNNRPVLQPGEIVLSSSDRNFIIMRKGGIIEVGATQAAKRFYIPLQNVIRDLCQMYEMQNSAGTLQMIRKESDQTWGTTKITVPVAAPDGETASEEVEVNKIPTEMNLRVKEYESDLNPIVSIDFGNITRTLIAEEGLGEDALGNIVHKLYTQLDENNGLAHVLARLNINNKVKVFVDKAGNIFSTTSGAEIHVHQGPRHEEVFKGNCLKEHQGQYNAFFKQVNEEIETGKTTRAGAEVKTSVGNLQNPETTWSLKPDSVDLNTSGEINMKGGKVSLQADGLIELVAGTDIALSCESMVITTTGDLKHISAKSKEETIINASQNPVAYRLINESTGELQIHNTLGSIRISTMGRPGAGGLAGVALDGVGNVGVIELSPFGQITVTVGTNKLVVGRTGCAMKTAGGQLSIDSLGQINLGGPALGAGNGRVVTTLTHPVCYVTGLPINGSTSVGAASTGLLPGPMTPTTFAE
ncbi:MAG: hypothetical protein CL902_01055 [Dehalococcoidia bacterium]|nr:hypothetical protein [Dehalococcoidia bacterium]